MLHMKFRPGPRGQVATVDDYDYAHDDVHVHVHVHDVRLRYPGGPTWAGS
jgi:hypothetical protein